MQADTKIPISPPLPGIDLVTKLNAIIETLGTNFAGPDDPAAIAWPFATWADTANMLLKRRNSANSAWVVEQPLLLDWSIAPYMSMPIGVPFPIWDHLPGCPLPPTDNPHFRFVKLTASDSYNAGALTNESVSGSAPLIVATAKIAVPGSPIDGATIYLKNTMRAYGRAGQSGVLENDALQDIGGTFQLRRGDLGENLAYGGSGSMVITTGTGTAAQRLSANAQGASLSGDTVSFSPSAVARTANETRVRGVGENLYMRTK